MKNLKTNTALFGSIKAKDANGLHLQDDGGNGMFIKDGGNVGIGTTNPVYDFEVNGWISAQASTLSSDAVINLAGSNSSTYGAVSRIKSTSESGSNATSSLTFSTRAADNSINEWMRINSAGNVGIGTTNPESFTGFMGASVMSTTISSTNGAVLNLQRGVDTNNSGIGALQFVNTNNTAATGMGSGSQLLGLISIQNVTSDSNAGSDAGGNMRLYTKAEGGSCEERMRITSDGNVGIGTANPGEKLSVYGSSDPTIGLKNTTTNAVAGISLVDEGSTNGALAFKTRTQGGGLSTRMYIDNGGNVGIGTTDPNAGKLAVWQTENSSDATIKSVRPGTADRKHIAFHNSNGIVGDIKTNGSTTSYNTSSDYRLKENVVRVNDAIERVNKLKPCKFNFTADPEKIVDGFLAHEVQEVVPEAISGEKDAKNEDGDPEYQSIDQSKLVPLLTAAIQEQQTIIEDLKSQNESLVARIEALEG